MSAFFFAVDLDGTVSGSLHPLSAMAAFFWAGPFLVYGGLVRTRIVAVTGGLALVAATAVFLVALFRDQHSTAGIGVLTIPLLLYPTSLLIVALDGVLVARTEGHPAWRKLLLRLLAAALSFVVVIATVFAVVGVVELVDQEHRLSESRLESIAMTVVSGVLTLVGFSTVRRLWRQGSPSSHDTPNQRPRQAGNR